MEKPETIFAEGIYLNRVSPAAPAFIITNQSIHIEKAIAWLQSVKHLADAKGYIRLVGKESGTTVNEKGEPKRYFQIDTWKAPTTEPAVEEDVPFN